MSNSPAKTALVVGATGLIGKQVVQYLLDSPAYSEVRVLVRNPLGISDTKLKEIRYDFSNPDPAVVRGDDIFCCLGTTMKKAGSKEAFRKVDLEYPLQVARLAKQNGARQYLIVTAMGADSDSMFFYNQVKGDVQEELKALQFPTLRIFQPSLLLGNRQETRLGEKIGEGLAVFFKPLMVGPLRKYRAIDSARVARAMVTLAQKPETGVFVYDSDQLQKY
ncbi:oxidoreductase [Telluribacter sp. SYSU D00476]|uniref:oxidoreductase n=1 Tax=Telluribacter sp. SYSU D00476 TaxID=2811430 RepID=UPI001FF2AF99|nr:oxidoreductase [Telluribacter sp. SYSU D00476]